MCGIVASVEIQGSSDSIALEALRKLEYRGYDSFGFKNNIDEPSKFVGAISKVDFSDALNPNSKLTIAHTRWATHGVVSEVNTHPHQSHNKLFAVVHNGVITNFKDVMSTLSKAGISPCVSSTDTEVISQLLEYVYGVLVNKTSFVDIVSNALLALEGEFAICITSPLWPNEVVCTKHKSPLVAGLLSKSAMISSDQNALPTKFGQCIELRDFEILHLALERGLFIQPNLYYRDRDCALKLDTRFRFIQRDQAHLDSSLGDSPNYMWREMQEIPKSLEVANSIDLSSECMNLTKKTPIFIGCGSAYYVAQIGNKYKVDSESRALVFQADEFSEMYTPQESDLLVCISQSGETYDTLEPARTHLDRGGEVLSITNRKASTLAKISSQSVYQDIGIEHCVLATKSVVSQCAILYRLFSKEKVSLSRLSRVWLHYFRDVNLNHIQVIAKSCVGTDNFFFVGRGVYLPVAFECALKFKEVTYCHAEGMGGGFFKHGTLSLIDDRFIVFAHIPSKELSPQAHALMEANVSEIECRNGRVIRIGVDEDCDIRIPNVSKHLNPLLHLGVGQYLAYFLAQELGRDVDQPRFLAKSVTVR